MVDDMAALFRSRPPPDEERTRTLAIVRRRLFGVDETNDSGAGLSRYVLQERLGAGGCGAVYRASDPGLGRQVAIKLIRGRMARETTKAYSRLKREAQAMARLSHPNVAAVFDVGLYKAGVFVVMELVEGEDLGRWLPRRRPSWREIVATYCEAGEGLAAAHDAGIVHRDVKPANVMLGRDGRVRVVDFGLACLRERKPEPPESGRRDDIGASVETELTDENSAIGTPSYMAPEQHVGAPAGPRTDQFSLCVSLYVALYGQRPFVGDSLQELVRAKLDGRVQPPPAGSAVPRRIFEALRIGLRTDPQARYPTMHELLTRLRERKGWGRRVLVPGVCVLVGALIPISAGLRDSRCTDAEQEVHRVWDDPAKARAAAAFSATDQPYAEQSWQAARLVVDEHAARWVEHRRTTCAVRGPTQEHRLSCLERRMESIGALSQLYQHADASVVEHAVSAAYRLRSIDSCAAGHARTGPERAATARARAAQTEAVRGAAAAHVLFDVGKWSESRHAFERAVEHARRADAPGMLAATLGDLAWAAHKAGDDEAAISHLGEALDLAAEAEDDRIRGELFARFGYLLARSRGDFDEAYRAFRHGTAALERSEAKPLAWAELWFRRGRTASLQSDYEQAQLHLSRALDARTEALGPHHPLVADALTALADTEYRRRDPTPALQKLRDALAIRRRVFGEDHPLVANALSNVAHLLAELGDQEQALALYTRTYAIRQATLEPDHPTMVGTLRSIGNTRSILGEDEEGIAMIERALDIERARATPNGRTLAKLNLSLGTVLARARHNNAAEAALNAAIDGAQERFGPDHDIIATALFKLSRLLSARGAHVHAIAAAKRAVEIWERSRGPDNPLVAQALVTRGKAYLEAGDAADAAASARRAVAIMGGTPSWPDRELNLASAEFLLARALDQTGQSLRAVAAARRALALLRGLESANPKLIEAIMTWLEPRARAVPSG